jgi:hypothetical protein
LFQEVVAIFFGTMGAESTWNFKEKVLLVFEVGSFWQFLRIFSLSPLMTLQVSLECWWVPILDKPIYDVLFQNMASGKKWWDNVWFVYFYFFLASWKGVPFYFPSSQQFVYFPYSQQFVYFPIFSTIRLLPIFLS